MGENTVRVGITDYAQHELGDLVFVNLPEVGEEAVKGERIADVESVKAVSDIYSPVNGVVKAVNEAVLDSPELINSDPYGTWLFEIEDVDAFEEFLDAEAYEQYCGKEG
jgi:glycine cleavage system H protein